MNYGASVLVLKDIDAKGKKTYQQILVGEAETLDDGIIKLEVIALPRNLQNWNGIIFLYPTPETDAEHRDNQT